MSPSGTAASTATTTPSSNMCLSTSPIRLQRASTSMPIWLTRKTSSPTGISSIPNGKANMFLKSRPARASDRPCNFSFTTPSLGRRDSDRARKQGLPVDEMDKVDWKEGAPISPGGGSISLIKGGPHPNAAKVFINWFLSRRGQIALQRYDDLYDQEPPNSRRIDIPKDMLPQSSQLVEGRRYFDFTDPKYANITPIYQLAKEFMKGREGK